MSVSWEVAEQDRMYKAIGLENLSFLAWALQLLGDPESNQSIRQALSSFGV